MSDPDQFGGHGLSDDDLLRRWLDETDHDGAASVAVFIRYRGVVLRGLQDAGLSPLEAVKRVDEVFHRARQTLPNVAGMPLPERLLSVVSDVVKQTRTTGTTDP